MGNLDLLEDACEALPHTTKSMFGGHGLFAPNGGMFAGIVDEDRIILKFEDETARAEFAAIGGEPWNYREKMTMQAWLLVPDELYDQPHELADWARRAHALAPPPKPKKPKKAPAKKAAAKKASAKKLASKKAPAKK